MDYLHKTLGIQITYKDNSNIPSLPNYIHAKYELKEASLDGVKTIFVFPRGDLDPVSAVKKHLDRIKKSAGAQAVLVLDRLTFRQKEYLLRDRIPFIVDGKQIYLPFMATCLQERCDSEKREEEELLPSAQVLLLYYIYHGCGELLTADAARALDFTAMSVSRASKQLEETGFVKTEKRGVGKVLLSRKTPRQMFEEAVRRLPSPVKRTVYVPKIEMTDGMLLGGYSALSGYSMLNPPAVNCYAAGSVSKWDKTASGRLQDANDQCAIELWRYDPRKLADGKCVDRLSLALALRHDKDERTEEAVAEMLEQVWRDIDGKRN